MNEDKVAPRVIYRIIGDSKYAGFLFVNSGGQVEIEGEVMLVGTLVWHSRTIEVTISLTNLEIYADMNPHYSPDPSIPEYKGEWDG